MNDWFPLIGSGCLEQRTNLLSPSVAHLPAFKVLRITATRIKFAPRRAARQQGFLRKKFSTGYLLQKDDIGICGFFYQFP